MYQIIQAQSARCMQTLVEQYIKEGWQVQGGISTVFNNGYIMFYQAMVK